MKHQDKTRRAGGATGSEIDAPFPSRKRDTPNGERTPPRRVAFFIRADIFKLSEFLRKNGEVLNIDTWGPVVAAVLDRETRGPCAIGKSVRTWPGLDALTLVDDLRRHGFKANAGFIDGATVAASVRKRKIGPAEIGRRLGLTAEIRTCAGIRNIYPVDETASERAAVVRQRNIERDRRRWEKRRAVYEAESASKTKPWEKEGISRRTWERRGLNVSTHDQVGGRPIAGNKTRHLERPANHIGEAAGVSIDDAA